MGTLRIYSVKKKNEPKIVPQPFDDLQKLVPPLRIKMCRGGGSYHIFC